MAPRSQPLFHLSPIDGTANVRRASCCSEPGRVRRRSLPFRSADQDNPPGPPALSYIARWLPPSILVRRPQLSPGPSAVRLLSSSLDTTLIMVRRPQLSPGPSAVRLLFSSLDTTFDYGPQTTAFSRPVYYTTPRPLPSIPVRRPPISPGPPAVPSIILPAGSYLYKVSRLKI